MIYTCTLNPSVDYILHVQDFRPGTLNRGENPFYYPGGKGINVSRVLARLNMDNTALGFLGGFTGEFIRKSLEEERIPHKFIQTESPTRVNLKLKSASETEINGPGPSVTPGQREELFSQLESFSDGDYFIASGSVPKSMEESFYVRAAEICEKKGVRMIADTSSKALKSIVGSKLFLVKPNQHELGELFDADITSIEDAAYYGRKLHESGAEHVIISLGGQGAVYINEETSFKAEVPVRPVLNTVGAGDSMVAGFLASYIRDGHPETAFRTAVSAGSATAFQEDLCKKEDVEELLDLINIRPLKQ